VARKLSIPARIYTDSSNSEHSFKFDFPDGTRSRNGDLVVCLPETTNPNTATASCRQR
jgi:hypothetical protein